MKESKRTYVRPSSLGSYFGVGFNDPYTQLQIDMGEIEETFDDEAEDRMSVGRHFEDSSLNYFEDKLKIIISNRNDRIYEFYDAKMRGKIDGMTWLNGEETVVENKVSQSDYENFIDKKAYIFQVQCYMLATNTHQALLCGFQRGRPLYKLVYRDDDMIKDIKEMVDFVTDVMKGIRQWSQYPSHLYEKYTTKKVLPNITELDNSTRAKFIRLNELRQQKGDIEDKIKDLNEELSNSFELGIFDDGQLRIIVSESEGRVAYDMNTLMIEHPEINWTSYSRKSPNYRQIRITKRGK